MFSFRGFFQSTNLERIKTLFRYMTRNQFNSHECCTKQTTLDSITQKNENQHEKQKNLHTHTHTLDIVKRSSVVRLNYYYCFTVFLTVAYCGSYASLQNLLIN